MKDRGVVNVVPQVNKPKGATSIFEITINPNVRFPDAWFDQDEQGNVTATGLQSDAAMAMIHRLQKLSNWILTDTGLKSILAYTSGIDEWDKIVEIPEDERYYAVEIGSVQYKLHSHLNIELIHNSHLSIDKVKLRQVAAVACNVPFKQMYVHIVSRGMTWKSYVNKYSRPSARAGNKVINQTD